MKPEWDLVIRGGTVVDGSGGAPFEADVAVRGERIAQVGRVSGSGREEVDARGRIVTPGFVDLHTHYDGQVTWENRLVPSSMHGVTTAILGNCGVGFAPCRPGARDELVRLMEGVEDIPEVVMTAGIPWNWESYPQYLDALAARRFDMDIGSYLPHAPLRVHVMGRRACDLEPATEDDTRRMAALADEALAAGALGIGTSRTLVHRSRDGQCIPTLKAEERELMALAGALAARKTGVLQVVTDFGAPEQVFQQLHRLARHAGRPLTFTLTEKHHDPELWRRILGWAHEANALGVQIRPQVLPRAVGMLYGHELSLNPFYSTPTYLSIAQLPLERKLEELRKPELRARILGETVDPDPANRLGLKVRWFHRMFELGDPPEYEPPLTASIGERAERLGIAPEALAYDLMMEKNGQNLLYMTAVNYGDGSLDAVRDMVRDPDTVLGLGDGGAHLGAICDASYPTFTLAHWGRDRVRGERLPLPLLVAALSSRPAQLLGLHDRGLVARGRQADLNVIDMARLRLHAPTVRRDLPAGGRRLVQTADGYDATVVRGAVVYRQGIATGALPGRLVRGVQPAPAAT
jgi:N-acyl-D-aspartate/D-glutamate deacylase